jgi:hypothetical protein
MAGSGKLGGVFAFAEEADIAQSWQIGRCRPTTVIATAFNLRRNKRMVAIQSFGGPAKCSPRDCHGFFIFENGH